MHHRLALRRVLPVLIVPALVATGACDIVTAQYRSEETAQWQKSYTLDASGTVEISNVNGKISVEPSSGNTVEVTATKRAKAASPEAAKEALQRISITEEASASRVKIETKMSRGSGMFSGGDLRVEYHVKVPVNAEVKFTTVNGGVDLAGLNGRVTAESTNGGVKARNIGGQIEATTTNGGVEVELSRVPDGGVKLECTNGGIDLRLPKDAKATISARITNGGIDTNGLAIETSEASRRRLEGRLNGGGPRVELEGTNGGISIAAR